jgi:two-component sensor histidine kinase
MDDEHNWVPRPRPATDPGAVVLGKWEPASVAELTGCRRQLSAALHDGARPPAAQEAAVERLLLAFEEIASNALRHARPPVQVVLTASGGAWVLDVSDADPDRPPVPATDRDPAHGGLGLPMVARITGAQGWTVEDGRKHVWAQVHYAIAEESVDGPRQG